MARSQIRLLKSHRGQLAHEGSHLIPPVRCEIRTFDIKDAPKYIALSYVWGSSSLKKVILVNGQGFAVGSNVFSFLKTFRNHIDNTRYLWIDQLCIDENKNSERSHQVRMMAQIYKGSYLTLIWLGEGNPFTDDLSDRGVYSLAEQPILYFPTHEYFTRLWIVQEVLLPPRLEIMCGSDWLPWDMVATGVRMLNNLYDGSTLFYKRRDESPYGRVRSEDLELMLATFSSGKCVDPRDKIYGLLGLFHDSKLIEVDYDKSVAEVLCSAISVLARQVWAQIDAVPTGLDSIRSRRADLYAELSREMLSSHLWLQRDLRHFLNRDEEPLYAFFLKYIDAGVEAIKRHGDTSWADVSFHEYIFRCGAGFQYRTFGKKYYHTSGISNSLASGISAYV